MSCRNEGVTELAEKTKSHVCLITVLFALKSDIAQSGLFGFCKGKFEEQSINLLCLFQSAKELSGRDIKFLPEIAKYLGNFLIDVV